MSEKLTIKNLIVYKGRAVNPSKLDKSFINYSSTYKSKLYEYLQVNDKNTEPKFEIISDESNLFYGTLTYKKTYLTRYKHTNKKQAEFELCEQCYHDLVDEIDKRFFDSDEYLKEAHMIYNMIFKTNLDKDTISDEKLFDLLIALTPHYSNDQHIKMSMQLKLNLQINYFINRSKNICDAGIIILDYYLLRRINIDDNTELKNSLIEERNNFILKFNFDCFKKFKSIKQFIVEYRFSDIVLSLIALNYMHNSNTSPKNIYPSLFDIIE